jgi:hypothetical protein
MDNFRETTQELLALVEEWTPKLQAIPLEIITGRRNGQNRTIKQIVGHLIDSASNNTHRIIHLQYQKSPVQFPNYASNGNNDRWIAIQNYQDEDWNNLVQLWKYSNLHIAHVIRYVDTTKLNHQWAYSDEKLISLQDGIIDYLRHFKLHLDEIMELLEK